MPGKLLFYLVENCWKEYVINMSSYIYMWYNEWIWHSDGELYHPTGKRFSLGLRLGF